METESTNEGEEGRRRYYRLHKIGAAYESSQTSCSRHKNIERLWQAR